jgi:hypothetical protein
MKSTLRIRPRTTLLILVLLVTLPALALADDGPSFSQTLRQSGAHQISGYVTLGLATTVAVMGFLGSELHPVAGWGLAGGSAVSLALGSISYRDRLPEIWPHAVLASLATTGFFLNALGVFPFGSQEHVIVGATSAGLLAGAYVAIVLLTW